MNVIEIVEAGQERLKRDPLLQPFRLKRLMLKNRIVSTSHASMLDEGGFPLERYQRYHEEKAKGGVALTMIGGSAMVSRDSSWGGGQINLTTDAVIPHLRKMSERIHTQGSAIMTQVSHLGRRATAFSGSWLPSLGPSRVRETRNRNFPKEMDEYDIERVIAEYADAAKRCMEAGLDGIETVTGGHLLGQFLSPLTNQRTDKFGGSLGNRARFGLMLHDAIRKAVGDDFIVGIRFVVDEATEGGLNFDDCVSLAQMFEQEGHIDYFNAIYGRMDTDLSLSEHNMPALFQKSSPFLDTVAAFRHEIKLPLIHAAGIRDVATARHVIREDIVDLVGMTRAHIADPHIVNKIMRGEEEHIRPCVGAAYCLYKKVQCIHNASSGREMILPHLIEKAELTKKVVVIGAGPGGLEAARVAAERGHQVVVFEAGAEAGGQVRIAASAFERRDLIGIIDWRLKELERLNVDIRYNNYAQTDDVLAEAPDAVIVATGGIPDTEFFEGSQHCVSVWDVLTGSVQSSDDVLVYDGTGRQSAASCAVQLAQDGKRVQFLTIDESMALEMGYTDRSGFRKKFAELGVEKITDQKLIKVEKQGNVLVATFRNELTEQFTQRHASQIIIENGTLPIDEIHAELKNGSPNLGRNNVEGLNEAMHLKVNDTASGPSVYRIGDAISSRDIYSSIQDAFRLCVKI